MKSICPGMFAVFRATNQYMEDMFDDVATETVRDVPEEYTKPDYYARKTCNYLTSVLQVFHQGSFSSYGISSYSKDCFSCLSPARIAVQRDILVRELLAKTETIPGFDNDKCPIIR